MRRLAAVLAVFGLLASLSACGREATPADCQLIVDRNVELQMKAMKLTDPVGIAKKQEELRSDPEMKKAVEDCVGRRVTDGMMSCVRLANSTDDVAECMR